MLVEAIIRAAQTNGARPATVGELDGVVRSWSDFVARVSRMARALECFGLASDARVGILGLNSVGYLEALYAIWWHGRVAVPMNSRFALAEHLFSINDAEIGIVLVDRHHLDMARQIAAARPDVRFVAMDETAASGWVWMEALIRNNDAAPPAPSHAERLAGIFYTGGTTGFPKGVMHSERSLWAGAACLGVELRVPDGVSYLHAVPMFHLGDMALSLLTSGLAGTHSFLGQFDPATARRIMDRDRIELAALVPTMIARILDAEEVGSGSMAALRTVVFGGSPISDALVMKLRRGLPQVRLCQIFGQTETVGNGAILVDEDRAGSAGRALFGNTLGIADEHGQRAAIGTVGEILVNGPSAMLGYWNNTELSDETLVDGWVRTGDAGFLDDDGYLYVCDRIKDMIISGGENVYSAEVENAIVTHPGVAAVAVIGVPDAQWSERVHAVIVPTAGATLSLVDIQQHCRGLIAGYKLPRSIELRDAPLPLSAIGKVAKNVLRQEHWTGTKRNVN